MVKNNKVKKTKKGEIMIHLKKIILGECYYK